MIDRSLLRQVPERVRRMIEKKDPSFPIDRLIELEHEQLQAQQQVDSLRRQKNEHAELGKQGITPQLREQARSLGLQLKEQEAILDRLHTEFTALYLSCPNIPADDLPVGGKESNKIVSEVGSKPQFNFAPKN